MNEKEKQSIDKTGKEENTPLEEILGSSEENKMEQQRKEGVSSKWMEAAGPEAEIVLSSRVRLARNITGFSFPSLASDEQREKVLQLIKGIMQKEEAFTDFQILELESLSPLDRQVLVEKHLISPLLAKEARFSALMFREDEILSIMVNEEDHLRLQCLLPGLQLEKAWEEASRYDDLLETNVEYAFHENYGYLTACPTNVGTGLRVSVMLHLPALVIAEQINRILAAVYQVGLAVRGFYGEGTEMSGSLFQISNQVTLGQTEVEIWRNLYGVTKQLISQEKKAREHLLNKGREKLADRAGRALGTLKYARLISSREAMQLLSDLRLGAGLGLIKGISAKSLNELLVLTRPGCLQYLQGRALNSYERSLERAAQIQKCLSSI
jgi:protein arginine kinase